MFMGTMCDVLSEYSQFFSTRHVHFGYHWQWRARLQSSHYKGTFSFSLTCLIFAPSLPLVESISCIALVEREVCQITRRSRGSYQRRGGRRDRTKRYSIFLFHFLFLLFNLFLSSSYFVLAFIYFCRWGNIQRRAEQDADGVREDLSGSTRQHCEGILFSPSFESYNFLISLLLIRFIYKPSYLMGRFSAKLSRRTSLPYLEMSKFSQACNVNFSMLSFRTPPTWPPESIAKSFSNFTVCATNPLCFLQIFTYVFLLQNVISEVYSQYIKNHNRAQDTLEQCKKKSKALTNTLKVNASSSFVILLNYLYFILLSYYFIILYFITK